MVRKIDRVILSKALRVLLSCTVFVMFNAMLRVYQDPEAPHDMYPGLESCQHIKDLAKYQYDGEYLIRSDVVAQLTLLWSQSNCSKYATLLSNSAKQAAGIKSAEKSNGKRVARSAQSGEREYQQRGPFFDAANPLKSLSGAAAHNPALVGDLPVAAPGTMTALHAPREPTCSSRSDDVPSPPPRGMS